MIFRLALLNLTRNSRRTLTILITIAMGSGSLFLYHGFNHGIMNQYKDNTIHSRYGHGQVNTQGYRDTVFEKPWEHWIEEWKPLVGELRKAPGVDHVFPRVSFFGLLTNGEITVSGKGQGVDGVEESKFFDRLNIEEGSPLSHQFDGIILGKGLAHALDVSVGDTVTVLGNTVHGTMNGADFTVTGIFHTGAKEFDDAVFRIQLPEALRLLDTNSVESVAIGLDSTESWPAFAAFVQDEFPDLEATEFAVLDKIYYQHSVDWLKSQFGVIRLIILAIVVLGIFNTISTGILERKQEIGNLRANGESSSEVMRLFLWEGIALGVLGSILGVALGYGLNQILIPEGILMPPAPGLTRQYYVRLEFLPDMVFAAATLSCLTTILATTLAATKASRIQISEALRSV